MDIDAFNKRSRNQKKENQKFFRKLANRPPKDLDAFFHEAHDEVFEKTDCLQCGNCCRTTSPIFYQRDIERASRAVKLKPGSFIEKYLKVDEDQDLVFKSAPCPFLGEDNYCAIYEDRPNACREYPHTDRKKMHQLLDLTYRNTLVCPAVLTILDRLKSKLSL